MEKNETKIFINVKVLAFPWLLLI